MLWQQAVSIPVDTHIPVWQAIAAIVAFAGAWAVMAYRLNMHSQYHRKHYEHQGNMDLHQTPKEREALTSSLIQQTKAHEELDNFRFAHIDKKIDEMSSDIKDILREVRRP